MAPLGKLKTIISSIVSLVTTKALNVATSFPCSYQALLASMLLKVRAKALLGSFLTPVIRLLPLGWLLIVLTTLAAVLALPSTSLGEHVTSTSLAFLRSDFVS